MNVLPNKIAGARKLPVGPSNDLRTISAVSGSSFRSIVTTLFPRAAKTVVASPIIFVRSEKPKETFRAFSTATGVNPACARNSCDFVQVAQLGRWKYQSIRFVITKLSTGDLHWRVVKKTRRQVIPSACFKVI